MYSVLLTAMMTTGATTPEFGGLFNRGCVGGCAGCYGGCFGGCSGCFGCSGCGGCCGGGFLGWGFSSARHSGCYGCAGGCGGCYGCYGGCRGGCFGGYSMPLGCACGSPGGPLVLGMTGPNVPAMPAPGPGVGEMFAPAGPSPGQMPVARAAGDRKW